MGELVERQVGDDARPARAGIEDDLVGAAEHTLHGLEIEPLARDFRGLFVLVVDLEEARRLTGRLGDGLLAIGLGGLGDLRGAPTRLRHHAIGVGLRLVLGALGVGARRLHVTERVDYLGGWVDLLELHLADLHAGAVMIEGALHEVVHGALDGLARAGEDRLDLRAADHLAHGAFGDRLHGAFGIADVENVLAHAVRLDQPEHREVDVDDVLVAGEHQALFRHVAHCGAAPAVLDETHAHVDAVDAGDLRDDDGLDRVRQVIIESRIGIPGVFAEAEHDAALVRLDLEETGDAPNHEHRKGYEHEAFAAKSAGQHGPVLVLAPPQQLLEIGGRWSARFRAGAPRALGSRPPGSAALIAPRHGISPQARRLIAPGNAPSRGYRRAAKCLQRAPAPRCGRQG